MKMDILTLILIVIMFLPILVPLVKILFIWLFPMKKLRAIDENGELLELDLRKKNDPETVIRFSKAFFGHD